MDPKVTTLAQMRAAMEEVQQLAAILYAAKQDLLTPDESITLQDGTISVATPVKAVTQAQNSLAQADKDSETAWLVTDIDDTPSGSESTQSIYSAEETVIGTWLNSDGRQKPVYRRRFYFYMDSRLNAWWRDTNSFMTQS